jgi:type I restriction enzyme S subunit
MYWDDTKETSNLWVSIKDLNQRVVTSTAEQITTVGVKHSNVKLQPPGTVLLSFKLTIGRVAIAGVPLYTNEAIAGLRTRSITHEYLYQGLQHWDLLRGVDQAIKGATLNKQKLKKIEFDFPESKGEQSTIAKILSTVDCAVEKIEKLTAKRQRIKTGLMQDLLSRGIDEHGNLRSEQTHKFKDSALGRIPVEWEVTRLDRAIEIIDCKHYTPAYAEEGVPIIRPRNIKESGLDMTDLDYVTEKDYALLTDKHEPADGDIVLSRNASFGIPVYLEKMGRLCIGQDVVVMRKRSANTRFVFFCLKSDRVVRQIAHASGGSTFKRIDLAAIRDLKITLPSSDDEQLSIATQLLACNESAKTMSLELAKLRSVKRAMMQDLLTGRRRVTNLLPVNAKPEKVYASQ